VALLAPRGRSGAARKQEEGGGVDLVCLRWRPVSRLAGRDSIYGATTREGGGCCFRPRDGATRRKNPRTHAQVAAKAERDSGRDSRLCAAGLRRQRIT
jgi:hypothetical protein